MALQSQLFRGDPKLEAAAISDPAHVFLGANGQHVRKIQFALFLLDGSNIDQDGIYGPRTAAAVSAFKQKRQIINTQGKIDDIVGKKTIARLDLEMLAKEKGGVLPLPPLPKPPPRKPPAPKPQPPGQPTPVDPAPPAALDTGSTNWRFSFFGNKGFTGAGIYTLLVSSTQEPDSKDFIIAEQSSGGDLLAGFKGECRGTFTTAKKIPAKRFQGAACDFQLAKFLGSDLLQGSMTLGIIGDDLLGAAFQLRNLKDETFGTTFTSGIINVHGRLRQR